MREIDRIAEQVRRAAEGGAWHGPSVLENLEGVTATVAAAHPLAGAHSVWEILNHVTAWNRAVARRLGGERVELEGEADWPPVRDASETAWQAAVEDFRASLAELRTKLKSMGNEELGMPVPGREHNNWFMLNGVVQHYAYHGGQIAVLRKAAGAAAAA